MHYTVGIAQDWYYRHLGAVRYSTAKVRSFNVPSSFAEGFTYYVARMNRAKPFAGIEPALAFATARYQVGAYEAA